MTKAQSLMLSALGAAALVIGIILASMAVTSAQESTATPTPSASSSGDGGTVTPAPNDTSDGSDTDSGDADAEDGADDDSGERAGCGGGKGVVKDAAATVLGLSEDELRAELSSGQTLGEVAVAQGMTVEAFTAALTDQVTAALDAQLAAGDITQEQYDEITADLSDHLDDFINSTGGLHPHGPRGEDDGASEDGAMFRGPFDTDAGSGA